MGKTPLIASHDLSELEEICALVGLIEGGSMVAGPIDEERDEAMQRRVTRTTRR